jgi:hypothetical protein
MSTSRLTWDAVKQIVAQAGEDGMTNRHIADALGADRGDVAALTLLMQKSGDLRAIHRKERPTDRNYQKFYLPPERPTAKATGGNRELGNVPPLPLPDYPPERQAKP